VKTNVVIQGDCLEVMRGMEDNSVDVCIVDPPYGADKAEWDTEFPILWYNEAKRISHTICIITGSQGLKDSISLVGDDFIDVIAARNMNGMTRTKIGFSNWLACVVAVNTIKQGITCFDFVVKGKKINHPSPKPIDYMLKLVNRVSKPNDLICDPFCGSGSTLVAAKQLGRRYIGIEIEPKYVAICNERLKQEVLAL